MYFDTEKILSHASLEQIAGYLLSDKTVNQSLPPLSERLEKSILQYNHLLEQKIADFHERDEILSEINHADYNLEKLCVIVGLQCGFSLALELLGRTKL